MSSLGPQTKQGFLQIQKEMQTFTCILQGRDQLASGFKKTIPKEFRSERQELLKRG